MEKTIRTIKRITAFIAVAVWTYVIYGFLEDPAPFAELAPYCMGSTMLIFGVLTGIYKGLEYWEQNAGEDK